MRDYLSCLRPDHWHKNGFILFGSLGALHIEKAGLDLALLQRFGLYFLVACLASSFNYGINEILDAKTDESHPVKRHRAIPSGRVKIPYLLALLAILFVVTLALITFTGNRFFGVVMVLFYISGLVYNVPPLRAKDLPYLDVVVESFNNPVRLAMGYSVVKPDLMVPPTSLLLSFWALGGFLMTAKRVAEYRFFSDPVARESYRTSFRCYSEQSLLIAMIVYINLFAFGFGIITQKYGNGLVVMIPFISFFIGWFFALTFEKDSIVKEPERLVEKPYFMAYCILLIVLLALLLFGNMEEMLKSYLFPYFQRVY